MSVIEDPLFLTSIGGILVATIGLILRYCYRIKCEDITICCGLMTIHRNIDDEMAVDLQTPSPSARRGGSLNNTSQMNMMPPRNVV
jgi:hypothetical protein